ncbi:MAG: non-hydrolyzing UDP-N-acetylglucosamine 2-epimerase [Gemmatimonadota bacterium]
MSGGHSVLVVIGTRPEGIKLAPVVGALRERSDALETRVALTGQHTDLIDQVLEAFELAIDRDLGIMREGQSLYDVAHGCLDGLRAVVEAYRPELVLVQGDTATVLFASLVAYFERTRVGHVEAGLRSRDKWRPYPEEVFRHLTGVLADLHFAPTAAARSNLLEEGVEPERIFLTGNPVVDAVGHMAAREREVRDDALRAALADPRRLVLVTAHRRESFGEPIREAFRAIRALADRHEDVVFLYPVHPNPEVRRPATALLGGHDRIRLTDPLDYFDLLRALRHATLVLTDSGGIQEEAPTFGTPVVVLRAVTERPEGVEAGVALLVGTDRERIEAAVDRLLRNDEARARMSARANPYGDGRAAERIADIVAHTLTGRARRTEDLRVEDVRRDEVRAEDRRAET